jgi:hypothetical protein
MVIDDLNELYGKTPMDIWKFRNGQTPIEVFAFSVGDVWPLIYAVLKAADEWGNTLGNGSDMALCAALDALDEYDEKERRAREADSG